MPKRSRTPDANETAFAAVRHIIAKHDPEASPPPPDESAKKRPAKKNPAAVALGRKGGLKGGKARAAKLTPEERSASARKAAQGRWARSKPEETP